MASPTSPRRISGWYPVDLEETDSGRARDLEECMLHAAHETKTALCVIDVILSLVERGLKTGRPPHLSDLETARAALRRASALLEAVLAHGGVRPLVQAPVDLKELVGSVAGVLRVMARGNAEAARPVRVVERYARARCVIPGDRNLLEAALVNLGFNSLQALGTRGGTVWLEVASSREAVEVRIRDSGPGFADTLPDGTPSPLRTTRAGGNGLGLPIARTAIEAHHGTLILQNREEGGAEVIVRLPRTVPAGRP